MLSRLLRVIEKRGGRRGLGEVNSFGFPEMSVSQKFEGKDLFGGCVVERDGLDEEKRGCWDGKRFVIENIRMRRRWWGFRE